jgi:hypothetical protein
MPDVLKALLEKYPELETVKIFRYDKLESGDVRCAFYCRGKLDDSAPDELKKEYEKLARNGDLLVWKLPKTLMNSMRRLGYSLSDGLPSKEESFYNLVYVFAPEIDLGAVAEHMHMGGFIGDDPVLAVQAQDLGYLFKRKE